jgi:hypothetical protein
MSGKLEVGSLPCQYFTQPTMRLFSRWLGQSLSDAPVAILP